MKNLVCLTVCALSLLTFASTAQSKSAQANGTFEFALEGATGAIVFQADSNEADVLTGAMAFDATLEVADPENGQDPVLTTISVDAQFDCMVVVDNRAAMSGVVTAANAPGYAGQQVLLVVEDKIDEIQQHTDGFAWGVYKPIFVNLTATDYDRCPLGDPEEQNESGEGFPDCQPDPGTTLTWNTADAELYPCPVSEEESLTAADASSCPTDPNGFVAGIPATPTLVDCATFPVSAYPLEVLRGHGDKIQVKNHP